MKAFQPRRFARVTAWTLRGERKNWITMGMVAMAVFLLFLAYTAWTIQGEWPLERWDHIKRGTIMCLGTICGVVMVCSTQLVAHLKTKERCVAYLSLPASPLEKFLSRLLYVDVLLPLTLPVAMVAADALASLFALTLGGGYAMEATRCAWLALDKVSMALADEKVMVVVYVAAGYVALVMALMTLCSVVFRQGQLAAAVCFIAALFATGRLVMWLNDSGFPFGLTEGEAKALSALLSLWLSYRVFRRMEVVPGRFTNL